MSPASHASHASHAAHAAHAAPSAAHKKKTKTKTTTTRNLPLVLVLDLDGTVVGDVDLLLGMSDVHALASKLAAAGLLPEAPAPLDFAPAFAEAPIVRPGFADFCRAVAGAGAVELFAYTCGTREWAEILVPQIERAYPGVKFRRPIIARDDGCISSRLVDGSKSLRMVAPRIAAALARDYPGVDADGDLMKGGRILFVDDIKDNDVERSPRQLVCPKYEGWAAYYDITRGLPASALTHPAIKAAVNKAYKDYLYYSRDELTITSVPLGPGLGMAHVVSPTASVAGHDKAPDVFWDSIRAPVVAAVRAGTLTDAAIAHMGRLVAGERPAATKATAKKAPK